MKKILYSQRLRLLWAAVCLTVGIGPILAVPAPKGKITVSGMVTDKNKQPLIGVTVIIKDTFSGTTTDNAGKYTINAASSDVLEFSLLGYTQQEALVGTRTKIDVTMAEDSKEIDAVVIEVGYGEQRKKDVSGSVGVVKVTDLIKAPVTSFDQAIRPHASHTVHDSRPLHVVLLCGRPPLLRKRIPPRHRMADSVV